MTVLFYFDRVWHKGLTRKLKNNGIDGNLLGLIESFLHNRYQRVVRDWHITRIALRTTFFRMYINDLPQNLQSDVKLFADDCFSSTYVDA